METKILLLIVLNGLFSPAYTKEVKRISVANLTCEYLVNPLGIDTETPRFSWKITDPANSRGQHQTAYRIQVSSTPDKLKSGKTDVWDSGVIASEQSYLVSYSGPKLQSGGDYYWKVLVYDRDNKASTWSKTARFSMGLLCRTDWKGDWIKHPAAPAKQHIWFRKHLVLNDRAASALLYVASTGHHDVYVNGQKIDNSLLSPTLVKIDKRVHYVTYDVQSFLHKGDNVIAVEFASGWTLYPLFASVDQALLVQLNGKTLNGSPFALHSDESWLCCEGYSRNYGNFKFFDMGGEEMDGRLYTNGWNTVDFDDSSWINAKVSTIKNGSEPILSAQMTCPTHIIDTITAEALTDTVAGIWKVKMSKSFTGFIEARFNGLNVGDSVFITISDNPYGIDNFHQNHLYIARGEKGETFRNRFNYFSGRYIYFSGLKQTPELSDFRGYAITSAPERTAQFECSSDLFNKIYETDLHTFEMCTTEGYTADCSNRERIGYGGEGYYLSSYGLGLPCFESGAFYVKRQRDFLDVQNQDGKMPNAAPQINGGGGILWGSGFLNLGLDQYLAYGDKKELEKIYPAGKRWLDFLNNSVTDGLVGEYPGNAGFFGDWVGVNYRIERSKTARAHFFNNCAYAMSLDFLIQIAEIIGKGEDVDVYRERLKTLREKIHERYYDPALESYLNGDQVRTAFALYAGVVPEELRPAVLKHLENDLTAAHPYFDIGDSSRYPYFKILFTYPQFQNIIAGILSKTTYPGYGYFLSKGETTWPETWEATHSTHIHTSYTGISAWFFKILAGIEPDIENPGYRTITIRPQVVDILTYAKAAIESPYGRIESGWLKEAGRIVYEITVPVNSNANIYLPAEISAIKESGNDLAQAKGINITEEKEGSVVLNVESGKYRFEVLK